MRKFKPASPLKISDRLRRKVRARLVTPAENPPANPKPADSTDFEETMARAFPAHLRGTISGCCDSMDDGHGNTVPTP